MMKISIMETLRISPEEMAAHRAPFEAQGHTFSEFSRTTDIPTLIAQAKDADVMILANMPMPGAVISQCDNLKFIDVAFTGVDHVDLAAAKEKGIAVSNASGYSNEAVAELAVAMALDLLRHVPKMEALCREGKGAGMLIGSELRGKTVGIIGFGKIGKRSAKLFHAFGAKILAQSRRPIENAPDYVEVVSQDELLKNADIVVLHCPLNDSTRGMINKSKLAFMKPTSLLVNVARGPVVVTQDLADALNAGTIAGAAIDVFDKEPPLSLDEPLLHTPNTLVTPHIAFASVESMQLRANIVFDNLAAWLDGKQQNIIL